MAVQLTIHTVYSARVSDLPQFVERHLTAKIKQPSQCSDARVPASQSSVVWGFELFHIILLLQAVGKIKPRHEAEKAQESSPRANGATHMRSRINHVAGC